MVPLGGYVPQPPVTVHWCDRCEIHLAESGKSFCPVCKDDADRVAAKLDGAA